MKEYNLLKALHSWEDFKHKTLDSGKHLNDIQIESLFHIKDLSIKERMLQHLVLCSSCSQKLKCSDLLSEKREVWETAWRKAAATEKISWPQKINSSNKTFLIEIREMESEKNRGFIELKVSEKNKSVFEGRTISVIDGKKNILLKGKIKNGELFAFVENLDNIDLRLLVRTLD